MTDSTTDGETTGVDVGPSMDELFGAVEEEPLERESVDRSVDEHEGIEDQTASDVFEQFRREADGQSAVDDVLGEESPDDIITGVADEEPTSTADELLDEDALEDLLLTGRRKADEFLWVDTGSGTDADEPEPTADEPAPADAPEADSTGDDPVDRGEPGSDERDLESEDTTGDEADAAEASASDADDPAGTADSASNEDEDEPEDGSSSLVGRVRSSLGL
ncbi:hypothetical protein [Natronobeatus ordinarius]|uniref:hypothetical protein n=1 Tax=Natronobeatus ordinarius TaxID=2963433 RepID=UPI0020CB8CD9|nr:hypothetical protein [Natronobeatus ordinarius]